MWSLRLGSTHTPSALAAPLYLDDVVCDYGRGLCTFIECCFDDDVKRPTEANRWIYVPIERLEYMVVALIRQPVQCGDGETVCLHEARASAPLNLSPIVSATIPKGAFATFSVLPIRDTILALVP